MDKLTILFLLLSVICVGLLILAGLFDCAISFKWYAASSVIFGLLALVGMAVSLIRDDL